MLNKTLSALALVAMLAPAAAAAQGSESVRLTVRPESKLSVDGTSNVHAWSCATSTVDAAIEVDAAYAKQAPTTVPHLLQKLEVRVPVRSLKCGHGGMDNNMYKALKADDQTVVSYILGSFTVTPGSTAGQFTVSATGTLSIAGAQRPVTIDVAADRRDDSTVRVTGAVPLLMTDFGIKPPTAMLGALKTGNQVTVKFDLLLGPQTSVAAAPGTR